MSFSNSFSVIIKSLSPHPSANDTRDSLEILPRLDRSGMETSKAVRESWEDPTDAP